MTSSPSDDRVLAALNAHQRLDREQCGHPPAEQVSHTLDDWHQDNVAKMRAAIQAADQTVLAPKVSPDGLGDQHLFMDASKLADLLNVIAVLGMTGSMRAEDSDRLQGLVLGLNV